MGYTKPNKGRRKWPWVALGCVAAALLLVVAVAWHLYSQVAEVFEPGAAGTLNQSTDPNIEANGERFYNLLVLGIDYDEEDGARTYAEGKGMTDVIMYVQVDRDTNKINVLQIPRDTYYGDTMAGGVTAYECKINEVYANGPDQENLINNLANEIYELYKLPIDNYVTIEMDAFKTLLNNMGGIDMYVPWDIILKDQATGKEELLVPQGEHHINGDIAELILRNRNYAQADYKRLETQQYFYAAVVDYFLNECDLAGYYNNCRTVAHYLNTDLDITEIWGLYATMTKVEPEDIYIVRSPGGPLDVTRPREPDGRKASVYYTDRDAMAELLNEHFRDPEMPVAAEKLGLPTGFDWPLGKNIDPGRTLGDVDASIQQAQSDADSGASSAG